MKLVWGSFESSYGPLSNDAPHMHLFSVFKNDVIIWSHDKIGKYVMNQDLRGHNLGKVSKYHNERSSRFSYESVYSAAGLLDPPPLSGRVKSAQDSLCFRCRSTTPSETTICLNSIVHLGVLHHHHRHHHHRHYHHHHHHRHLAAIA